jgi:predicted enzyme related to lactoylglutathione lyase
MVAPVDALVDALVQGSDQGAHWRERAPTARLWRHSDPLEVKMAQGVDMALEVVTLPVSDIERAKSFYQSLGWRLDIDLVVSDEIRTIQFTPPHSPCSIQFGKGGTAAEPGSAAGMILVVKDIDAARADLVSRGVDVSEVQERKPPAFASSGRSYFARATFSDPDGNAWQLQEITTRLPGREWED